MSPAGALRGSDLWRTLVIAGALALAFAPALPLLFAAFAQQPENSAWVTAFLPALIRGMQVAVAVALVSFVTGLPLGLGLALHEFPLRRLLGAALALGLLLPSFLVAIGLSMLGGQWPGLIGTVWSLAPMGIALVALATFAAVRHITGSQIGAARLAGGERTVVVESARAVWPVSALAATFAGILALSDPGPGLVFGHRGAAAEILTSFSAQYDFPQAARQCLLLSAVIAILALPCATRLAPILGKAVLARDTSTPNIRRTRWADAEGIGAFLLMILLIGMPLWGLVRPLTHELPLERAIADTWRTAGYTAVYALSAGVISAFLGFGIALAASQQRIQALLLTGLLVLIALPPAFTALGWVQLATATPRELDWFMRGGPVLALHLGMRFLPIAALFALRALNSASPSWSFAAELHGVRPLAYVGKVLLPWAMPLLLAAAAGIALLSLADITSTLLLHPPGGGTIPLTIFTVMANAPEAYVAALCLAYILGSAGVVALAFRLVSQWR